MERDEILELVRQSSMGLVSTIAAQQILLRHLAALSLPDNQFDELERRCLADAEALAVRQSDFTLHGDPQATIALVEAVLNGLRSERS